MKKTKKSFSQPHVLITVVAVVVITLVLVVYPNLKPSITRFFKPTQSLPEIATVRFPNVSVEVEIAKTDEARRQGLSGRESLEEKQGMLFVFSEPAPHAFWMYGMRFPLDFVWISNNRVVDITQNVPIPNGTPPVVTPSTFVTHVLEVNAGFVAKYGITIDDPVEVRL